MNNINYIHCVQKYIQSYSKVNWYTFRDTIYFIYTSISYRSLTHMTKSCCRQSLTISMSGWPSELWGIINFVDQRLSRLSCSERRHLSRAKLIAHSTIDMPWRNFLRPEFRKSSRGKYPYFYRHLNFLKGLIEKKPPRPKKPD